MNNIILPREIYKEIIDYFYNDINSLIKIRLTCKLFRNLTIEFWKQILPINESIQYFYNIEKYNFKSAHFIKFIENIDEKNITINSKNLSKIINLIPNNVNKLHLSQKFFNMNEKLIIIPKNITYLNVSKINFQSDNYISQFLNALPNTINYLIINLENTDLLLYLNNININIKLNYNNIFKNIFHIYVEENKILNLFSIKNYNINIVDYENKTPINYACYINKPKVIKTLLILGANVNIKDNFGNSLLHNYCQIGEQRSIINLLISNQLNINELNNSKKSVCYLSYQKKKFNNFKYLIEIGCDVNIPDKNGSTLIHLICQNFDIYNLLFILSKNIIKFNFRDNFGNNYLNYSSRGRCQNTKLIKLLIKNGENPNNENNFGITPLMESCSSGNIPNIKILLKYGANINYINNKGNNCLYFAYKNNQIEVIKFLLNNNADINQKNNKDQNCFHFISMNNSTRYPIYITLLKYKINFNQIDIFGLTPLHYSIKNNNYFLTSFLLNIGSKINQPNSKNILEFCLKNNVNKEIIDLINKKLK